MGSRDFSIKINSLIFKDKIQVIKTLRYLTGLGLKEAKDASETLGVQHFTLANTLFHHPNIDPNPIIEDHFRILRNEGIEIGESVERLLDELRELGAQALKQGEDELANEILQLVLAEKLRRKPQWD
jgi:hypothetical protein